MQRPKAIVFVAKPSLVPCKIRITNYAVTGLSKVWCPARVWPERRFYEQRFVCTVFEYVWFAVLRKVGPRLRG